MTTERQNISWSDLAKMLTFLAISLALLVGFWGGLIWITRMVWRYA